AFPGRVVHGLVEISERLVAHRAQARGHDEKRRLGALVNLDLLGGDAFAARGDARVGDADQAFLEVDAETECDGTPLVVYSFFEGGMRKAEGRGCGAVIILLLHYLPPTIHPLPSLFIVAAPPPARERPGRRRT